MLRRWTCEGGLLTAWEIVELLAMQAQRLLITEEVGVIQRGFVEEL